MFVVIEETHDGDLFRGVFSTREAAEQHAEVVRAEYRGACVRIIDKEGPHNPNE